MTFLSILHDAACDILGNRTPRRTVDKFGITNSTKTYEVYDAEGTVKIVSDNNDTVVGAVCIFNPKNREHGKRKIEGKIAKNIAIGIGLFGLVWIPLPLFVLINYNIDHTFRFNLSIHEDCNDGIDCINSG
jgi:hypothetical protein